MRKKFEWIEHPSDIGFRAYGRTLAEAFQNAGAALFEIMTDLSKISAREQFSITLEAEDKHALLYDWIDRLLYLHDSLGVVLSKFEVQIKEEGGKFRLEAKAWGEKFDPSRHPSRTSVKAMTYHMMEIKEEGGRAWVQAVVDI
jgi:SHS2 domain-containing protein